MCEASISIGTPGGSSLNASAVAAAVGATKRGADGGIGARDVAGTTTSCQHAVGAVNEVVRCISAIFVGFVVLHWVILSAHDEVLCL